jgi:glucose/galactose transporter
MSHDIYADQQQKRTSLMAMVILGMMFFIFGFTSWINSILVPFFKAGCELTHFQSYLIVFAMYFAYLIMALPAGSMLKRIGYKRGIMLGFFTVALGALTFIPAAWLRSYPLFLLGSFVMGLGSATLQSAANPYVTVIGPLDTTTKRMAIMGICNKLAGMLAPLIFAAVIFTPADDAMFKMLETATMEAGEKAAMLDELVRRVIVPYAVFAAFLVCVGLAIRYSKLPEIDLAKENKAVAGGEDSTKRSVFDFPYLILGVIAMFFHISTQVVTVDTIVSYAASFGVNMNDAKFFPSATFALVIFGNVLGALLIPKVISQTRVFRICCALGLVLSVGVIWGNFPVSAAGFEVGASIWFLVGLGLANSLIYAGIWPLAIRNLGRFTKTGSSMLIMALFGNAVTPLIYGAIVDASGSYKTAYLWILLPCFAYLVWYSFHGYKITSWKR